MVDEFGSFLQTQPDDMVNITPLDLDSRQEMGNDLRSLTQLAIQKKHQNNNANPLMYQDLKRLSYA